LKVIPSIASAENLKVSFKSIVGNISQYLVIIKLRFEEIIIGLDVYALITTTMCLHEVSTL